MFGLRLRFLILTVVAAVLLLGPTPALAQGTPEPSAEGVETLLTQTLSTDELPAGPTFIGFFFGITAPGFEEVITAEEAVGPALLYMLSGELTTQSEAALKITRAGTGTVEEVAPNTETVIRAGDAIYFQRNAPRRAMNAGAEPATWLVGLIIPPGPPPAPREGVTSMPLGFIGIEETSLFPPGAPVTVTMQQIVLSAQAELTLDATPAIVSIQSGGIALIPSGGLSYTKGPGENVTPGPNMERPDTLFATPEAEVRLVGTDTAIVSGGGSVRIINVEDRPAVLLVMSIVPAASGGATPVS